MSDVPEWMHDYQQTSKVIRDLRHDLTEHRSCLIEANTARVKRLSPEARALVPKLNPVALHRWLTQFEKVQTSEETT